MSALEQMSAPLEEYVKFNGLPTENVLATNSEKIKLFNNFSCAIEPLPIDKRMKSDYLTKIYSGKCSWSIH